MPDGMAPEGLPEKVVDAIDAVMERVEQLSRLLDEYGYVTPTTLVEIAKDELVELLEAEHEEEEE